MASEEKQVVLDGAHWKMDFDGDNTLEYTDRSGNVMKLMTFEGMQTNFFFPVEVLKEIKNFKLRPDDVFVSGFPRTGTNWAYEKIQMLLNRKAETIQNLKSIIEITPEEEFEKFPSPRVVNAHIPFSMAPKDLAAKKVKSVFCIRDPKDAIVSNYKIIYGKPWSDKPYMGSFEDYLYLFLEGKVDFKSIFGHWAETEAYCNEHPDVPVHFLQFEEGKKDPVGSVQKLSDFLGLPRNDDLCKAIAEKCDFAKMKSDKEAHTVKIDGKDILYRQGKSGDWRNYFSEQNLDDYYRVYDEKMAGSRFYKLYARDAN